MLTLREMAAETRISYDNLAKSALAAVDLDKRLSFINPALKQQPRYEPAPVIAVQRNTSILEWLESQGRLIERDERDLLAEKTQAENDAEELALFDRAEARAINSGSW